MLTTSNSLIYDYIIIGGGLAGLYAYERLKEKDFTLNILLLEKNNRIGGRMKEQEFHGTNIKLGGGIVDDNCYNMLKILKKYKINTNESDFIHIDTNLPKFDMNGMIASIKYRYFEETGKNIKITSIWPFSAMTVPKKRLSLTVDEFLKKHYHEETIKLFYLYADYLDFPNQDINDFIMAYPIDDLKRVPMHICSFKFNDLLSKLSHKKNIVLEYEVKNIKKVKCKPQSGYGELIEEEVFSVNEQYYSRNIITATTVNCLKRLFKYEFLNEIKSVPFYRKYIYSDNLTDYPYGEIMAKNEIKKMIKFTDNVIMAVYCESDNAQFWYKVQEEEKNKPNLSNKIFLKLLKENNPKLEMNILDEIHQYWNEGIHYYTPNTMDREQWIISHMNPEPNVYVIGEMMGIKQGWMEAALESVVLLFDNHLNKK